MKRAGEYGAEMTRLNLKGPALKLSLDEIASLSGCQEIKLFRIGRRRPSKVFLLVRKGYGTLYVKPKYSAYRKAYELVFPDSLTGRDIDHLWPKCHAHVDEYIALGHIDELINRTQKAKLGPGEIVMKAMNELGSGAGRLTLYPRPFELGRMVQNGYLRPFYELRREHLREIRMNQDLEFELID